MVFIRVLLIGAFALQLPQSWYDKFMPSWGAFVLFFILAFLTWWRERGWKSVAESRKETIGEKDTQIQKLQADKETMMQEHHAKEEALVRENQTLHTRTDLQPVTTKITDWIEESRGRFGLSLDELKKVVDLVTADYKSINDNIVMLIGEMKEGRQAADRNLKAVSDAMASHFDEDHSAHTEDREHKERFVTLLSQMEERMTLNQQLVMEFLESMRKRQPGKNRHRLAQQHSNSQGKQS